MTFITTKTTKVTGACSNFGPTLGSLSAIFKVSEMIYRSFMVNHFKTTKA